MNELINNLKRLCKSKWNILSITLGLFPSLINANNIIVSFTSQLPVVIVWLIIVFAMFVIHYYNKYSEKKETTSVKLIGPLPFSYYKKIFTITLFLIVMSVASLIYINKRDIYFVILNEYSISNKTAAINQSYFLNNKKEFKIMKLKTRVIDLINNGKSKVILYNGYITHEHAKQDSAKVKKISNIYTDLHIVPSKHVYLSKKLKYYLNHIWKKFEVLF